MKSGFSRFRRNSRADKAKRQAGQRRRFFRPALVEKLEDRQMLSGIHDDGGISEVLVAEGEGGVKVDPNTGFYMPARAAVTGFLPVGYSPSDYLPSGVLGGVNSGSTVLGNNVPALPNNAIKGLTVQEAEPNDTIFQGNTVGIGTGTGQDSSASITGTIQTVADYDYYKVHLKPGDIISILVTGGANDIALLDPMGRELQGSQIDVQGPPIGPVYPAASPLLSGGNAAISYVVGEEGDYSILVSGNFNPAPTGPPIGGGPYTLQVDLHRPFLESQPIGTRQILYLDFDGAILPRNIFDPLLQGNARLSPLDDYMVGWGLDTATYKDAVIDSILETVNKQFSEFLGTDGRNGHFSSSGVGGEFDIEIRNSRDHADPWGQPNVSRIVVGGSLTELLIQTIGIAQSIDVGNFETEESAVVLLDLLSAAGNNPNSLNNIPRHPATTIVDVIGRAVGTIVTHEAGHFFGAWHQDNTNTVPMIMDSGGNFANTLGLGPDGIFGTDDDIEVNFGKDRYSLVEFFTGTEDTADGMAFGLSTGKVGSTISGIKFNDANGNGRRDTGEAGLPGFTIYADLNVNGILDAGEPRSVSDSTGAYSLQVPTGSLRIAEVQQAGYRQTFPAAPGIHTVTLTAGQTVTGINFGNQAIVAQAVGTKWLDTDGDGVKDAGEPGIAGVWIYVDLDQDGRIDTGEPATVTNQFGQYTLALPGAGTYQLREVLGPGYVQTFPGGNGAHTVTVTGTETVGRDFGNMPAFDYGDAPVDYVALTLAGEARHGVLQGFHLGAAVDGESGPQSSNDALGDDNTGQDDGTGTNTIIDDEDGVIIPGPFYIGKTNSVTVNVETGSIAPGMLQGWIDYNRDGVWSDNEQIVKNRTLGTGSHVVTFTVPTANTVVGNTFARFRYSHIAGLGPLGSAPTGEVEDYQVLLLEDRPNANDDTDSVLQDSVANPIPVLANDFSSSTGILNITAAGNNGQSANLGVVTISANKQTIFYSPRPGFFGTDTFTYTVTDGANHFDTATVTVTVLPNFENPVAVDDSFSVTEGSSNRLDVLANDIQGRTPPINIVSFGPTLNGGTVQIIEGGAAIQYTPPANFGANVAGDIDQFTYTIADNDVPPNLSTATVTISRNPVDQTEKKVAIVLQPTDLNGRPLGAGEQIQVGQQFQVQVLVDDLRSPLLSLGVESAYLDLLYSATNVQLVDIEFSSVYPNARNRDTTVPGIINELGAVAGFPDPGDGLVELVTLTLQAVAPGTVDFKSDPADDLPLHETVRRASDRVSFEEISYGTASVTITGDVAGGPKAVDDSRSLAGGSIVIPVLANDSQGTGATKELLTVGNVSNGTFVTSNGATVTKNADGTITYNANGFVGTEQFTYTMGNGTGVTSTAEVTVHVGSNINRIADVILEAVNPATGLPITTQIQAGSRFLLNVYVRDNRALPPAESGVFAAYIDLLYDKDRAQVVSSGTNPLGFSVVFGPDFQNQLSGAVVTEGFIDEVGGVGNQTNPGDLSQVKMLLATIEFTATQTGNLVFRADPADIPLTHDFLLYDGDVGALSPSQVDYSDEGVLLLNVVTGQTLSAFTNSTNPLDVNADGTVSPIDVLHVINDLNRGGSRTLQAGSGSPAEGEGGADHLLYIDVNGDSMVSPIDALRVINFLNNRNGGLGEGEFASFVTPDASLDASSSAAASMVVDVVADTAGDTNSLDTSLLSALSTNVATADDAVGDNTSNDSLSDAADTTSAGASSVAQQNRSSQQFDSFDSEADWDSLLTDEMLDDICSAWDESSEDKLFGAL